LLVGASLVVMSAPAADAKEARVTMESLPAVVRKTAAEQSRGATVRGISTESEHGKTLYEVELTVDGHKRDVLIAADGTVAEVEEEIDFASVPKPVQATFERAADDAGKVHGVEAVSKGGKLAYYEGRVQKNGKKSEVMVRPDGTLVPKE